ncbi:MAG: hypothetical protein U0800_19755 [Isosphaeraceae bacterium]
MGRSGPRRFLAALACFGAVLAPAVAQAPAAPFGIWAEVVSVSDRWLIVEDESGKQYPVALAPNNLDLFLIRWPITLDRLGPDCLIEASGINGENSVVLAPHADVYRGANQGMVNPTFQPVFEPRVFMDPYNIMMMNIFGPVYMLPAPDQVRPRQMHVVGPWMQNNGLTPVIQQQGNAAYFISADSMTEVTPGNPLLIRPGDLAFCLIDNWNGRTLRLQELVIYKSMPTDMFVP